MRTRGHLFLPLLIVITGLGTVWRALEDGARNSASVTMACARSGIVLGVITPAAHMFAFYFAIMSAITPPVALAVYAAAGLAHANLWETRLAAVRVGAAGFLVPFMFVFQPGLLMIGTWAEVVQAAVAAAAGILFLAAALHGFLHRRTRPWERAALAAAAFLLIHPAWVTDVAGLALGLGVWAHQRRTPEAA